MWSILFTELVYADRSICGVSANVVYAEYVICPSLPYRGHQSRAQEIFLILQVEMKLK